MQLDCPALKIYKCPERSQPGNSKGTFPKESISIPNSLSSWSQMGQMLLKMKCNSNDESSFLFLLCVIRKGTGRKDPWLTISGPFPEMLDCGGRNYKDGSCALFSLSNQRPVIFSPLKEEVGEQVSWRALFYLCQRDCAARTTLYFPWTHFTISYCFCPSCELNWNGQILANIWTRGREGSRGRERKKAGRWRCCTRPSARIEPSTPDPAGVLPLKGSRDSRGAEASAVESSRTPTLPLQHSGTSEGTTQPNALCYWWKPPCNTGLQSCYHMWPSKGSA